MVLSRRKRMVLLTFSAPFLMTVLAWSVFSTPLAYAAQNIGPTDPNIKYVGRWDTSSTTVATSYWPGAYLMTAFTGTTVSIRLASSANFYTTIDHGADVFHSNASGTINLTLTPLASGTHTLRVAAFTEGDFIHFQGLVLDTGATTVAPNLSSQLIEFIGDSITAGATDTKRALSDYAWLIGEQLGVRHTQIAQGGICLVDNVSCPSGSSIGMSRQFFKLQTVAFPNSPNWDFSRYQANAVVINLGTNDFNRDSDAQFQSTYETFLRGIRSVYPAARIFVLRTFANVKVAPTQAAIQTVGDPNVQFVDTTGWLTSSDFTDGIHPSDSGQMKVANRLAPLIASALGGSGGTNVLTNGNTEAGTTGWLVFGSGTLTSNTSVVHSGTHSLLLTGRTAAWNGISQTVTSKLTNGKSYTSMVWVRTQSGTSSAKVTLALTVNGSTSFVTLAPSTAVNSSGWTLLSGTATVSWSGTLSNAVWYVETASGTDNFFIDDALFQ
ncbi:MAG TPA: carbohydrate binding domain-containing protein [Ktedonobacteraceae bacterium]|nr:carbohydrate binding domain-containing protein [Ktedonobacteraceae bacterium]